MGDFNAIGKIIDKWNLDLPFFEELRSSQRVDTFFVTI